MGYFVSLILLTMICMHANHAEADSIKLTGASARQKKLLRQLISDLTIFEGEIPEQRIDVTAQAMKKALEQQGYLNAAVRYTHEGKTWHFQIEAGRRYKLSAVTWSIKDDFYSEQTNLDELTQSFLDKPITNELLESLQRQGMNLLRQQGYAFVRERGISVTADKSISQAAATIELTSGPQVCFGATRIEGLARVSEDYVRRRLCWREGDGYSLDAVNSTRQALLNSRLFKSVAVSLGPEEPQDCVSAIVKLVERPPSGLSLGASYATSEGPGLSAIWENRNLGGAGQRVYAEMILAQRIQLAAVGGRQPIGCFWGANLRASLLRKEIPSFVELCGELSVGLNGTGYLGDLDANISLQALETTHSPDSGRFGIVAAPISWSWIGPATLRSTDTRLHLMLQAAPAYAFGTSHSSYLPLRASIHAELQKQDYAISFYGSIGSMLGSSLENIPIPSRFFEGSFEGLRGYAYQTVAPLDCCGIPIGGRSLLLFKTDIKFKLMRELLVGPFLDIGNVFASSWPDFNTKPLKSAGIALDYSTLFGPIRAAFAIPFDRRPCFDKSVFIYIAGGITF